MPNSATDFHTTRRAFIIMPGTGLTVAPNGFSGGHMEMLINLHYPRIRYAMDNFPRGYFMNGELCIYTGHNMTPGAVWEIRAEQMATVIKTVPDFRRVFDVGDDTGGTSERADLHVFTAQFRQRFGNERAGLDLVKRKLRVRMKMPPPIDDDIFDLFRPGDKVRTLHFSSSPA